MVCIVMKGSYGQWMPCEVAICFSAHPVQRAQSSTKRPWPMAKKSLLDFSASPIETRWKLVQQSVDRETSVEIQFRKDAIFQVF